MQTIYDVLIIGGGIVGVTTAMRLAERLPDRRILLVEKESEIGRHQTSHNSGVIHSGIYYAPGSLKAKLCVEGARLMIEFARQNNVPHELCGKIIVAAREREVPWLRTLYERGLANQVPGLELIDRKRIRELEPHAGGLCGIYSPTTGIINFRAVAEAAKKRFLAPGREVVTNAKVTGIRTEQNTHWVETTAGAFQTRYLINCGGLFSDQIAIMAGLKPDVRIVPFRGEYHLVADDRKSLVRNLIYPVPQPDLPFLGVHFTRTVDGTLEAGPNAVLALAREGYRQTDFNWKETVNLLLDGRFWRMAGRHWRTGIFESHRSMDKCAFTRALQMLVPDIHEEDLIPGPTGVRAQCVDRHGALVNDFKIEESPRTIHVLNVPSPAATASLAIATHISELAARSFCLQ